MQNGDPRTDFSILPSHSWYILIIHAEDDRVMTNANGEARKTTHPLTQCYILFLDKTRHNMMTSLQHNSCVSCLSTWRAAVRFYSDRFVRGVWDKQNPSLVFSGDRKIPTRAPTVPVGNEACRVSQWTVDPRVGIFLESLNTNDRFFFSYTCIPRPHGTVL